MMKNKCIRIVALLLPLCIMLSAVTQLVSADSIEKGTDTDNLSQANSAGVGSGAETESTQDTESETTETESSQDSESSQDVEESSQEESSALEESALEESSDADSEADIAIAAFGLALENGYQLKIGGHDKYMQGDTAGNFRPNAYITRGDVCLVIYNLLLTKPQSTDNGFSDVPKGEYYTEAINALKNIGIIDGYAGNVFKPRGYITRAEVVKILAQFTQAVTGDIKFTDVPANQWYAAFVVTATAKGWVEGYGNGLFKPRNNITRAEFVTIMNKVLERHDEGFAADRNNPDAKFPDVPSTWYTDDIFEAAKPAVVAAQQQIVTIAGSVNFRTSPSTSASVLETLAQGKVLTRLDNQIYTGSNRKWYKASYNNKTGYICSDYVTEYSGNNGGGGGNNSSSGSISATSLSVPLYKTAFLLGEASDGSTKGLSWSSSNESVASVFIKNKDHSNRAFVYGKSQGTATISFKNSAGTVLGTCTITVSAPETLRFTYAAPNTPVAGSNFELIAVTDTGKDAVTFTINGQSYTTTEFSVETKSASATSAGVPANSVRVFKKTVSVGAAGTYPVSVSARTAGGSFQSGKTFSVLVVSGNSNVAATTTQKRSASKEIIDIIAAFEGTGTEPGEVYIDTLSSGKVPTVGYGFVVYKNDLFYNNLTDIEMKAMLSDTINNGSYVKDLNSFREKYNVAMSQQQFDALVSFGYNLGTAYFADGKCYTFNILLNSVNTVAGNAGTINAGNATVYASAGGSSTGKQLANGAPVTINNVTRIDGNVDNLWYQVTSGSITGWIRGGYVRINNTTGRDLNYIDEQLFGSNMLEWNKAGSTFYEGLYYRRMAEARIFCFGDYANAYRGAAGYKNLAGFTPLI